MTVPSWVLLNLTPNLGITNGVGELHVLNATASLGNAPGLDLASVTYSTEYSVQSKYQ